MAVSKFITKKFGNSAVYTCKGCKKQTRETGQGESDLSLCAFCFEEATLENDLNDGNITEEQFNERLAEFQKQYKRGPFATGAKADDTTTLTEETEAMTTASRPNTKSRSKKSRHERAIIRRYLKAATELAAFIADESENDEEEAILTAAYDRASAALATLPGYAKTSHEGDR